MQTQEPLAKRERKTKVLNFRVPPSVQEQLLSFIDPSRKITSADKAARELLIETLAGKDQDRKISTLNVDNFPEFQVFCGDAEAVLSKLPKASCRTCITSPPYFRQRDYGHPAQIGHERSIRRYVSRLADAFDEVHRLLTEDGALWVVIDDSYWKKQLMGVPWRLAFELQERGWFWRAEIVWSKSSTPEAAKDRPTRAHEAVLLFSKRRADYFYNYEAILEPHTNPWAIDCIAKAQERGLNGRPRSNPFSKDQRRAEGARGITRAEYGALMNPNGKNCRDVWQINTEKYSGSHSAVMPLALAQRCVLATSQPGDVILDPFCGTATTGVAALSNNRKFLGVELVPRFLKFAEQRLNAIGQRRA